MEEPKEKPVRPQPAPLQCNFWVAQKHRYCKFPPKNGQKFCPCHIPNSTSSKGLKRTRIPCPLDPNHTIYEDSLQRHLKKCNTARYQAKTEALPFFKQDINAAQQSGLLESVTKPMRLSNVTDETVADVVDRIEKTVAKLELELRAHLGTGVDEMNDLQCTVSKGTLYDPQNESLPASKRRCESNQEKLDVQVPKDFRDRHETQQQSIVNHITQLLKLKRETKTSAKAFVELGAGKGKLSITAFENFGGNLVNEEELNSYALVDRNSFTTKTFTPIPNNQANCYRIDIKDLSFVDIPEVSSARSHDQSTVVFMSKHLCGPATCLTLRGAIRDLKDGDIIAVAMCCHHTLDWASYVNPNWILKQGFTANEFDLIRSMCGWATCGWKQCQNAKSSNEQGNKQQENNPTKTTESNGFKSENRNGTAHSRFGSKWTTDQRKIIGLKCKKLLNIGRLEFLLNNGFDVRVVEYVPQSITLENSLLVATKRTGSSIECNAVELEKQMD